MLSHNNLGRASFIAFVVAVCGCSASSTTSPSTPKADGGADASVTTAARPKTKPKTASLKSKAGSKPPAGATSIGAQTQPMVGALAVPITNVEAFAYQDTFSDDAPAQTFDWAYVDGKGTYIWAAAAVTCADGTTDPGAGFLMGVAADGTGTYIFSLPGCPAGNLFGCDFDADGNETTCGVCSVTDGAIACATSP